MDIVADILKWVIVILIAGFIGQFGKSLSLHIIDSYKKKKAKATSAAPLASNEEGQKPISSPVKEEPGADKASSLASPAKESTAEKDLLPLPSQEKDGKAVKKALKAQQKAQKKMDKAKQKAPQ